MGIEKNEDNKNLEAAMGLIVHGGNAKSFAFEAIKEAKKGNFKKADKKLKESDDSLLLAHNAQTEMLAKEAQGKHTTVTLITVHSQDHLMNAITFRDLAGEIVDLYKKLAKRQEV